MTERKVLNKYFPPDYDPSKIPRLRRGDKHRQFNIRTMAPFNMRCSTCNGYIYKAKKFNSRMEIAEGVDYLGLRHYRFHIRCPTCCAEIIWRTDLDSGDYVLESGAKRNFEALKTAEELEAKRAAEEEEELANNPMKLLEKRTNQSKEEMEMVEVLEDLKQLNQRQATMEADHLLLRRLWQESEVQKKMDEEEDEAFIREVLDSRVQRIHPPSGEASSSDDRGDNTTTASSSAAVEVPKPRLTVESLTQRSLHKLSASASTASEANSSYMKKQLKGAILVGKRTSQASACTSSTSEPVAKKQASENTVQATNPLGLAYSDNSDSD